MTNIHRGHVAVDIVQSDVLSAVAPSSATATLRGNFIGNAGTTPGSADPNTDILSFYSAAMDIQPAPGIGDLKFIEYICEPTGSGDMNLVRLITTNLLPPNGITPTPRREVVVRGLVNFTVQYFDGQTWFDTWDSSQPSVPPVTNTQSSALPKAVEIRLEFKGQQGRQGEIVDQTLLIPCGVDQAVIAAQQAAAQMGGGQ